MSSIVPARPATGVPDDPALRFRLGCALAQDGRVDEALVHLRAAARRAPRLDATWPWLAHVLARCRFAAWDAEAERDLVACLRRDDVPPESLGPAAMALLCTDAPFAHALAAAAAGRPDTDFASLGRALDRPLLRELLQAVVVQDLRMAPLLAAVRRAALLAWHDGTLAAAAPAAVALLGAVAHQCFLVEYLHDERADETALLPPLQRAAEEALAREAVHGLAPLACLLACYRPLAVLPGIARMAGAPHAVLAGLVARQVSEPVEEAALAARLPRLTPIRDATSTAVRAQYEANPYPRWARAPVLVRQPGVAERLQCVNPAAARARPMPASPSILVAGCGTGWVAALAGAAHPRSRILAVDLSLASLGYAARRARELRLGHIEFAQADLLELASLEERFDVVECEGVLHHLADPMAGWRVLTGLLAPGGVMRIGLYSEAARRSVAAARRLIAAHGFGPDPAGMRAARAALLRLPREHPARGVTRTVDFHTASGCRDLLFHVQEHCTTLPALAATLQTLGLDFLGFEFDDDAVLDAYRRAVPDDPRGLSLAGWTAFEAAWPDTFFAMYRFWVAPAAA